MSVAERRELNETYHREVTTELSLMSGNPTRVRLYLYPLL